jgi:phage virion morphogenesis protein
MANIEIKIDDREVRDLLRELGDRANDLTPAMKQIGEYMRLRTEENFANQVSPEGRAWQALNPKYAAQKRKKGGIAKILQFTGDLRSGIAYQVERRSVFIGTNIKVGSYSLGAIHQFGAPRRNIPARPFLGVSQADQEEITLILRDYLTGI